MSDETTREQMVQAAQLLFAAMEARKAVQADPAKADDPAVREALARFRELASTITALPDAIDARRAILAVVEDRDPADISAVEALDRGGVVRGSPGISDDRWGQALRAGVRAALSSGTVVGGDDVHAVLMLALRRASLGTADPVLKPKVTRRRGNPARADELACVMVAEVELHRASEAVSEADAVWAVLGVARPATGHNPRKPRGDNPAALYPSGWTWDQYRSQKELALAALPDLVAVVEEIATGIRTHGTLAEAARHLAGPAGHMAAGMIVWRRHSVGYTREDWRRLARQAGAGRVVGFRT